MDLAPPAASESDVPAKFTTVDLTDYGQVVGSLQECDDRYRGIDAVIHLAAIPAPGRAVSGAHPLKTNLIPASTDSYLLLLSLRSLSRPLLI